LAGAAAIEFGLDVRLLERKAGRAPIDDATQSGPVAFAKGGDAEEVTEAVVRHVDPCWADPLSHFWPE
jgi:hypothetical protein